MAVSLWIKLEKRCGECWVGDEQTPMDIWGRIRAEGIAGALPGVYPRSRQGARAIGGEAVRSIVRDQIREGSRGYRLYRTCQVTVRTF